MLKITPKLCENYAHACGKKFLIQTLPKDSKVPPIRAEIETHITPRVAPFFWKKKKYPKEYLEKPVTFIELLYSYGKGEGTRAIKKIVRDSLNNETEGRVRLFACTLDSEKMNPMGFYYKMGFRFLGDRYNRICEEWLRNGGTMENRPFKIKFGFFAPEEMYLPKENIRHCLNYPEKSLSLVV